MEIKSYEDAVKYLESFIGKVIFKVDPESVRLHPPLDRMKMLLSLLDNPQDKFKSILVGGTSGKGSTAYLISHILTTAGYKTGLTISPHLQKINERLQINGKEISDKKFTETLSSIVDTIELMKKTKVGAPSYFEILIAMAFLYFAMQKVEIAVVEVGMGGEYDATNTLYPLIAVLTNVSLDHTNILGKTVQEIASTKVGIIKSIKYQVLSSKYKNDLIVVSGVKQASVVKIVQERCKDQGAKLYLLQKDFGYKIKKESLEGSVFDLTSTRDRVLKLNDLKLLLLGEHQVKNASLAVEVVLRLKKFGFNISENAIRKALKTALFPGRFEYLIHNTKYKILLDGAHNPVKMRSFLASLKKIFPKQKKIFVVGFKFDKDIPKMLQQITKVADKIIVTEFDRATDISVSASAETESIKYYVSSIKYKGKIYYEESSKRALSKAFKIAKKDDLIVITGSLYLVGEIRNML